MQGWTKFTRQNPCPICGHPTSNRLGVCKLSPDESVVLCFHVESGCMTRKDGSKVAAKDSMGWMHSLKRNTKPRTNGEKIKTRQDTHLTVSECRSYQAQFVKQLKPEQLSELAAALKVSTESLKAYGVGFDEFTECFSFPMQNGKKQPIGFHLRSIDGKKMAVKGSRNGIFIPSTYDCVEPDFMTDASPLLLLMPEGVSDSCACYDLGFRAVGRPSNVGGVEYIVELLENDPPRMRQDVVVVGENDPVKWSADGIPYCPGREGCLRLADAIHKYCATIKIVRPPDSVKDIRQWLVSGGGSATIQSLIDQAECLSREKLTERVNQMAGWKVRGKRDWDKRHGGNGHAG